MTFDLRHIGRTSDPYELRTTWKDHALYALGIGATSDELPYLYERHPEGFRTFPSFATIAAFKPVFAVMIEAGFTFEDAVHGGQSLVVHRPLPAEATTVSVARLVAAYDLRRFAQAVVEAQTLVDGELCVETTWTIIVRNGGGFKGPRTKRTPSPKIPRDQPADWVERDVTRPEQGLLYRLNGDLNPLHADPAVAAEWGFEQGPILHGLATYGFLLRAALRGCASGDVHRLRALHAQFKKPVWPGDTIATSGWEVAADDDLTTMEGSRIVALQAHAEGRTDPVVTNAWIELAPPDASR